MDVEKIQKINDMALKLQQQGGMNREEAIKQAEAMLSKNSDLEVSEISSQKLQDLETKKNTSDITWQEAMEKNTKFIVKEFKDIQKEIINLKAEMDNIRHQIKNIKITPPAPQPKQEIQKPLQEKPAAEEKHPKQGDCRPEDFSVEKMFYCGNK